MKLKAIRSQRGFTLVEMLVVLAILAILAGVTVPFAEVTVKRNKEMDLREDLRQMRSAIDAFHEDWLQGVLSKYGSCISEDGYPKTLDCLVAGVDTSGSQLVKKKYLRRIPENPLGDPSLPPDQQWALRSYPDDPDSTQWGGQDVYDVYCASDEKALNGSYYHDW